MDSPSAFSRPWRMTLIVIAEILVSVLMWFAVFWVAQRSRIINPFFEWRILGVLVVTFSQLLMLAVITALWDFKRSVRWLVILAILVAESTLLAPLAELTRPGLYMERFWMIFSLQGRAGPALTFALILTIGVATVLSLHVLLWPLHNMLGWRVHWSGEPAAPSKPQFTLWQLLVWTALIAVLLALGRTLAEFESWAGITTFVLLWGLAALLTGFPTLVAATRSKRFFYWLVGLTTWLVFLSWAESELTFVLTKISGNGSWLPLWFMLICNWISAIAILLHVLLLRWLGMRFNMRLPFVQEDNITAILPATRTMSSGA